MIPLTPEERQELYKQCMVPEKEDIQILVQQSIILRLFYEINYLVSERDYLRRASDENAALLGEQWERLAVATFNLDMVRSLVDDPDLRERICLALRDRGDLRRRNWRKVVIAEENLP